MGLSGFFFFFSDDGHKSFGIEDASLLLVLEREKERERERKAGCKVAPNSEPNRNRKGKHSWERSGLKACAASYGCLECILS